jgi:hypothetical protein
LIEFRKLVVKGKKNAVFYKFGKNQLQFIFSSQLGKESESYTAYLVRFFYEKVVRIIL